MSDKIKDSGPAFPTTEEHGFNNGEPGMTLRQYAAIKLRIPNSGTDWLDKMICQSIRDELEAKVMQGIISGSSSAEGIIDYNEECVAWNSHEMANAMLNVRANAMLKARES